MTNEEYGKAVLAAVKRAQLRAFHSFPPKYRGVNETQGEYNARYDAWMERQKDRKQLIPRVNTDGKKAKGTTAKHSKRRTSACSASDETGP